MNMEDARAGMSRDAACAVISAALLLCPALALAQSSNRPAPKPVPQSACVYKGVMSDAEVEACTGHPVKYDYRIRESRRPLVRY